MWPSFPEDEKFLVVICVGYAHCQPQWEPESIIPTVITSGGSKLKLLFGRRNHQSPPTSTSAETAVPTRKKKPTPHPRAMNTPTGGTGASQTPVDIATLTAYAKTAAVDAVDDNEKEVLKSWIQLSAPPPVPWVEDRDTSASHQVAGHLIKHEKVRDARGRVITDQIELETLANTHAGVVIR